MRAGDTADGDGAPNHAVRLGLHRTMGLAGRTGTPLRLSPRRRVLAGVCGGIGAWLGIDPWVVRIVFVCVSVLSSAFPGILVYVALWIGLPRD